MPHDSRGTERYTLALPSPIMHARSSLPLALALTLIGSASGQAPEIATYQVDDEPRVVRRADVARDVSIRYRRTAEGGEATQNLIDTWIIRTEAQDRGVWPGRTIVEKRIEDLRQQFQQTGRTLDEELANRRISPAEFFDVCAITVAHERLFRADNEVDDRSEVTPTLLQLWLREARERHEIEQDQDKVPEGTVAIVDGHPITLVDHGTQMLHLLPEKDLQRFARRIALREIVSREGARLGVSVEQSDIQAEVDHRRKVIESDPSYRGVPYENWLLQIRGQTVAEYLRSEELLATVRHRLIGETLFSAEALQQEIETERESILERHGERRRTSIIVVDGNETGRPRSIEDAKERADQIYERVSTRRLSFERAVEQGSDDRSTKAREGDLGPVSRGQEGLPTELLNVIFELEPLEVSEPVQFDRGFAILKLMKILPAPSDEELVQILREEKAQEWLEEKFEAANFEMRG